MSKRRLSQQQKNRIQVAQNDLAGGKGRELGTVVSHQGGRILIELDSLQQVDCQIKSNLGSIVCGDRVALELTKQQQFRIVAIHERDNLLQRVDGFGQVRSVAANLSRLFICLAVTPEPNLFLLDQYLLSAEQQHIEAIIVFNKIDLENSKAGLRQIKNIYQPLDYPIVATSVKNGQGMDQLKVLFAGNTSLLGGVSGVGKSSLTKWLLPQEPIKIATLSSANEEGRHTTRTSRLYHLPGDGVLIDTPGVRGFNPALSPGLSLAAGFREIDKVSVGCRFYNCRHLNEPKCAVTSAVGTGEINSSRYQSYLKLLRSMPT